LTALEIKDIKEMCVLDKAGFGQLLRAW